MATQELIDSAIKAFDEDDAFGRKCTLHSIGMKSRTEFIESLKGQTDERLQLLIEEITDA